MEAVLIARFKTIRDAKRISRLIKEHTKSARSITGTSLEDLYLGEMIEKGMKEKKDHSVEEFKKYLNKRTIRLSR